MKKPQILLKSNAFRRDIFDYALHFFPDPNHGKLFFVVLWGAL